MPANSPCDGSTISTSCGNITLSNITARHQCTTSFATLTGSSIIYVPPSAVNWQPLVTSWLERIFPRGGENETDKYLEIFNYLRGKLSFTLFEIPGNKNGICFINILFSA